MAPTAQPDRGRLWQRLAAQAAGDAADGELVRRLAGDGRDAAFAALVRRHGPLVLGVCRRVLHDHHAAEDAFQATFLVLLRRADAAGRVASLAGWLHGVAVRVARKARGKIARDQARDRAAQRPVSAESELDDVRPVLDEEIGRLKAAYREPLVLCYFEGKTYQEAARVLGWPEGTVCGRLARARDLLRERLTRRGVVCSAAGLAGLLVSPAVAPALETATFGLLSEVAPPTVAVLAATGFRWPVWGAFATLVGVAAVGLPFLPPAEKPSDRPAVRSLGEARFAHPAAVVAVAMAPDNGRIVTAGADEVVLLWSPDGRPVGKLPGHRDGAAAVTFAPDGRTVATAAQDGGVRVWTLGGEVVQSLPPHGDAASAVAFSPDGRALATVGWDGQLAVWNLADRKLIQAVAAHRGKAWGVAFSHDGRSLATAGDQEVRTWTVAGEPLRRFAVKGGAYAVGFTDPNHVVVSCDNTAVVYTTATGQEVGRVGGPRLAVAVLAVSPDGRTIAWAGGDRGVHLWEVVTRQERLALMHTEDVTALAFAPDGDRLLAGGRAGGVTVWHLGRLAEPPDAKRLPAAWADLTGSDAVLAYRAVRTFAAAPDVSLPFLTEKLPSGPRFEARVGRLIADLDAAAFADREAAARELRSLGPAVGPALRRAAADTASAEVRRRAEALLDRLPAEAATGPMVRVLEVLERIGSPEARQVLAEIAAAKPASELTRQAGWSLDRLRRR